MIHITSTLIGGLAILLAPATLAQIDGDPSRASYEPIGGETRPLAGAGRPSVLRHPLPVSRPAAERVAERAFAPPTRSARVPSTSGFSLSGAVIHDRLHYDVTPDGAIWVRGVDFKARADQGGFRFVPFLGSHAPRSFPVEFRLLGAVRDGASIELSASAEVEHSGDRLVLHRGDVEVRYDIALHSVEQSFALEIPDGTGDLVLMLAVETDLFCSSDGAGLLFSSEHGGMSYGSAVVIDAAGRRSAVGTVWTGESVELVVPGAFLDVATGPIIIDPICATVTIDDYSAELQYPDMAYYAAMDTYCFVYEEIFAMGDVDVYSVFVSGTTSTISNGGYIDMSMDDWTRPRVAAQQNDSVFFVVATSDGATAGQPDVVARTRSAIDGSFGTAFILEAHTSFYSCHSPDIGGDNFLTQFSYFCVVYNRDYGTDNDVVAINIDVNGNNTGAGTIFLASNPLLDESRPAVSKSTGNALGATRFNVAWSATVLGTNDGSVEAAQLSYDGNTIYGPFNVAPLSTVSTYFDIEVSCQSDVLHGGAQTWIVAYDDSPSHMHDGFVALCADDVVLSTVELPRSEHADVSAQQDNLVIGTEGNFFALAYQEDGDQYVTIVQPVGAQIGITERRLAIAAPAPVSHSLTIGTTFEGGGVFGDGLVAWSDVGGGDADILAARFFPDGSRAAGFQYCYGAANSTAERGFIQALGNRSTTSTQTLVISGLPSAFGFCLASLAVGDVPMAGGSQGTLCLGGSIGRFGIYSTAGTMGTAQVSVHPAAISQPTGTVSAMSGETWHFQSWHRDSVGGVAVSNFTNAVAIPFL